MSGSRRGPAARSAGGRTWGHEPLEAAGGQEAGREDGDALVVVCGAQALAEGEAVLGRDLEPVVGRVALPVGGEGYVPIVAGPAPLAKGEAPRDGGDAAASARVFEGFFEVGEDAVVLRAEADGWVMPKSDIPHVILQDLIRWKAVSISREKYIVAIQIKTTADGLAGLDWRSKSQGRVWRPVKEQSRIR